MLHFEMPQTARKALMAATLAATAIGCTVGAASPAMAQRYGHHRGGGDAGVAIGAGILGLAVGAAIASESHPVYYRERYYDGPAYYREPVYYDYPDYYYDRPYPVYRYRDDWRGHHRGYYHGHGWGHR